MTIKAKSILEDKFWIIEDNNKRVGTLSRNEDRYFYQRGDKTEVFNTEKQMKKYLGKITWTSKEVEETKEEVDMEIYGFPTSAPAATSLFDIKRKLPLFTKSIKSTSLYCAGYYIIRFEKGWLKSFSPKIMTLESYDYQGPFKTSVEMKEALKIANRTT